MAQQQTDSKTTFKEKFVPPELSMITYFMTKPFVEVKSDAEFSYNSDDSMSSDEESYSDDEYEEDLNRPRMLYVSLHISIQYIIGYIHSQDMQLTGYAYNRKLKLC